MCGINAVINGELCDLFKMQGGSSKRGKLPIFHAHKNGLVQFNWLPITDLQAGQQPFESGKYKVWLNGFISNYKELAEKYNIKLNSTCDTELLSKFLDKFNGQKLDELNGFFAVLYHDGYKWASFTDRYGIKKLYKYNRGNTTFISSEINAILGACPEIKIDHEAVNSFKYDLGVMNNHSLYKDVFRVKCLPFYPVVINTKITYDEAREKLLELWLKSCERNKTELNDCVFLSGGIDSGIIAKYMKPKYAFSMDYADFDFSESLNIKLNSVGIHMGMICNRELFEKYSNKLMGALHDPKVGSSYTNMALTEMASKYATVVYSGAGGDEFFGGYPHRINKPINEVIKRTSFPGKDSNISHFQYDLKFLRGVLNVEDSISGYYTMEARYPLLDNDFVNFALTLPEEFKQEKLILKDISELHPDVVNSSKKGFSNPYFSNNDWVNFVINYIKEEHAGRFIQR